ncbi:SdrD B-like domain-containing protein [Nocardioides humi]
MTRLVPPTALAAALATATLATTTTPAHADAGSGVIRGTVLETGYVIAPGIDVSLYTSAGAFVAATVTDSQAGAYQFSGLEAGSYLLWFENQNEAVSEWYDNQPDQLSATPVALADGATRVADAYLTQVSENLVRPTVSGTAAVGSTLTATQGTWFPTTSVEFRYQWRRGGAVIDGATQPTYTLRDADSGSRIAVEVIAVHQGATESALSAETATVTGGQPPVSAIGNTTPPAVSGSTTVGSTLTATPGVWTPSDATVTLQWLRGATVVGSGTSYTTTAADVGATLRVQASATKTGWTAATASSAAFGPITDSTPPTVTKPVNTALPSITGTARVGDTLVAGRGAWTGDPTAFGYQWTRAGVPIPGATGDRLQLTALDAGTAIGVAVTATNAAGTTSSASPASVVAKAASSIAVVAKSPKRHKLKLKVSVTSAGARSGAVVVKVKVGGKTVTRTYALAGGTRTLTLRGLRSGRAKVTVRYTGDASTTDARLVKKRVPVR